MAKNYVYKFYAELRDFKPKIWRRFQIAGTKTMAELGYALMILFEMQASHLFCITKGGKNKESIKDMCSKLKELGDNFNIRDYEIPVRYELFFEDMYPNEDEILIEADEVKIKNEVYREKQELLFNYDYGDNWEVSVQFEGMEQKEISLKELPCVIDGEGYGIIEDVGGTTGLSQFTTAMKKGSGTKYKNYCNWLGVDSFDMQLFDKEDLNFRLQKLMRVYKDIYEYDVEISQKSIDIIERRYKKEK